MTRKRIRRIAMTLGTAAWLLGAMWSITAAEPRQDLVPADPQMSGDAREADSSSRGADTFDTRSQVPPQSSVGQVNAEPAFSSPEVQQPEQGQPNEPGGPMHDLDRAGERGGPATAPF